MKQMARCSWLHRLLQIFSLWMIWSVVLLFVFCRKNCKLENWSFWHRRYISGCKMTAQCRHAVNHNLIQVNLTICLLCFNLFQASTWQWLWEWPLFPSYWQYLCFNCITWGHIKAGFQNGFRSFPMTSSPQLSVYVQNNIRSNTILLKRMWIMCVLKQ